LKHGLSLIAVLLPALLMSSDTISAPSWHIQGTLSEACSCSVPCRCNFGGLPSPHRYCYSMYSYKVAKGQYGDLNLDGLKFGSVDARHGRTVYIDQQANVVQRAALLSIAESVLGLKDDTRFFRGQSMAHIATKYTDILQEWDGSGNHVTLGEDGEFRAQYIIGRDGKNPVVVKNNTTWAIDEAIKGKTSLFKYKSGNNHFAFQDTNSNQGDFDYKKTE
jgi:hypothetical protein